MSRPPYRDLDPIRGLFFGAVCGLFAWIGFFSFLAWLRKLLDELLCC